MKPYSLTKSDFGPVTKPKREMSSIDFLRNNCDIHGRLGDTVYRRKRNGERYSYPFEKREKYAATTLSKRSDIMMKKIIRSRISIEKAFREFLTRCIIILRTLFLLGCMVLLVTVFLRSQSGRITFCRLMGGSRLRCIWLGAHDWNFCLMMRVNIC